MKKIGMIGGMSWESTKIYYAHINQMTNKRLGGSNSADLVLSSVNFNEIESLSFKGDWEKIGDHMYSHAELLEKAGADLLILCTNTIHLVKERIEDAINIPFIHIADATGAAIKNAGLKKVGLLGTRFTMENDFYSNILEEKYGLHTIIPDQEDREVLQEIIYGELVKGIFNKQSKNQIIQIIKRLQEMGVEGVILGCTELPIILEDTKLDIPSFDTTRLHAQMAVDLALS